MIRGTEYIQKEDLPNVRLKTSGVSYGRGCVSSDTYLEDRKKRNYAGKSQINEPSPVPSSVGFSRSPSTYSRSPTLNQKVLNDSTYKVNTDAYNNTCSKSRMVKYLLPQVKPGQNSKQTSNYHLSEQDFAQKLKILKAQKKKYYQSPPTPTHNQYADSHFPKYIQSQEQVLNNLKSSNESSKHYSRLITQSGFDSPQYFNLISSSNKKSYGHKLKEKYSPHTRNRYMNTSAMIDNNKHSFNSSFSSAKDDSNAIYDDSTYSVSSEGESSDVTAETSQHVTKNYTPLLSKQRSEQIKNQKKSMNLLSNNHPTANLQNKFTDDTMKHYSRKTSHRRRHSVIGRTSCEKVDKTSEENFLSQIETEEESNCMRSSAEYFNKNLDVLDVYNRSTAETNQREAYPMPPLPLHLKKKLNKKNIQNTTTSYKSNNTDTRLYSSSPKTDNETKLDFVVVKKAFQKIVLENVSLKKQLIKLKQKNQQLITQLCEELEARSQQHRSITQSIQSLQLVKDRAERESAIPPWIYNLLNSTLDLLYDAFILPSRQSIRKPFLEESSRSLIATSARSMKLTKNHESLVSSPNIFYERRQSSSDPVFLRSQKNNSLRQETSEESLKKNLSSNIINHENSDTSSQLINEDEELHEEKETIRTTKPVLSSEPTATTVSSEANKNSVTPSRPHIPVLSLKENNVGCGSWLSGNQTQGDTYNNP